MKLLSEKLPRFYDELIEALSNLNMPDVISKMAEVGIERYSFDEITETAYIYTNSIKNKYVSGEHGECIELLEIPGMVIIDIDDKNNVMGIEILDRPDVIRSFSN